jgi:hypothetical protein
MWLRCANMTCDGIVVSQACRLDVHGETTHAHTERYTQSVASWESPIVCWHLPLAHPHT